LVRVDTDEGITGWGEAFGHAIAPATKTALDSLVAAHFIGRNPTDVDGLMTEMAQRLHIFGRNGPVVYALSGIDIALWDIAGKRAGSRCINCSAARSKASSPPMRACCATARPIRSGAWRQRRWPR